MFIIYGLMLINSALAASMCPGRVAQPVQNAGQVLAVCDQVYCVGDLQDMIRQNAERRRRCETIAAYATGGRDSSTYRNSGCLDVEAQVALISKKEQECRALEKQRPVSSEVV